MTVHRKMQSAWAELSRVFQAKIVTWQTFHPSERRVPFTKIRWYLLVP